jgi:hypothetical protein
LILVITNRRTGVPDKRRLLRLVGDVQPVRDLIFRLFPQSLKPVQDDKNEGHTAQLKLRPFNTFSIRASPANCQLNSRRSDDLNLIGRAQNVALGRQHRVVEVLGEHRCVVTQSLKPDL